MEGYVFALMGNSGTDPDLEEEEEEKFRALREKELELRYLIKTGEDVEEEEGGSGRVRRLMEQQDARLQSEPAVTDHYSVVLPHGVKPPSPLQSPPRHSASPREHFGPSISGGFQEFESGVTPRFSMGFLEDEEYDGYDGFPSGGGMSSYLIKLPKESKRVDGRELVRPARLHPDGASSDTDNLPPLRVSYPNFARTPFPIAPRKKSPSIRVNLLRRQQIALTALCSMPPKWPTQRFMVHSHEVLRRYYESLGHLCSDTQNST